MDSASWIWEENTTLVNDYNLCEDVTNHWLYFIFSGYLLPLISPRVRDWFKEFLNSMKNSEVGGKFVTLTEFGFQKVQDIENNDEMKEYIKRLLQKKDPSLYYSEETLQNLTTLFSGDEKKDGIAQSYKKLLKLINNEKLGIKVLRP